jgi:hypothetical protein
MTNELIELINDVTKYLFEKPISTLISIVVTTITFQIPNPYKLIWEFFASFFLETNTGHLFGLFIILIGILLEFAIIKKVLRKIAKV